MTNKEFIDSICLAGEEWKHVDWTNGRYMVSSLARILSCSFKTQGCVIGWTKPRLINPYPDRNGNYNIEIFNRGLKLHYLVAETFLPNPDNYPYVIHINGDKSDNKVSNLKWVQSISKSSNSSSDPMYNHSIHSLEGEVWADVDGTDGNYSISSFHRVRSNRNRPKILTQILTPDGYAKVAISRDGKRADVLVHILVAKAFVENPRCLTEIDHIDGNRLNNLPSNLKWVTHSENMRNPTTTIALKKRKPNLLGKFGKDHPTSKPIYAINENGERIDFEGSWDADRKGYKYGRVQYCLHHPYKTYCGFHWRYVKEATANLPESQEH